MIDDRRARRNVAVLVAAQAFLGAQMPMIFLVGGLAGQSLASNVCLATLPIAMIVLGSMLSATPVSAIMQRFGRRAGFFLGAAGAAAGGAVAAYVLSLSSFPVFPLCSLLTVLYLSCPVFFLFPSSLVFSPPIPLPLSLPPRRPPRFLPLAPPHTQRKALRMFVQANSTFFTSRHNAWR